MSEFLASLDQWAFQILMMLYHLMGVQDLPSGESPHWKVVERWAEQPSGHYRLVLESETIQDECRSGRARYVIFPQTNMSKQEIYIDNIRVYTNEIDNERQIKSFLDQPVISCDLVMNSSKIKMIINSYLKYYTSINYWHKFSLTFPKENTLHNLIYVLTGVLAAFAGVLCFGIVYFLGTKSYHLLFMGGAIFLLMYAQYPFFYNTDVRVLHLITLGSIIVIAYVVLFEKNFNTIFNKSNLIFSVIIFMQLAISNKRENLTQLLIITNSILAISIMFIRALLKKYDYEQRIVYFVTALVCSRELYANQADRSSFLNVSMFCFFLLLIMTIRTLVRVYKKNIFFMKKEEILKSETKAIKKLEEVNQKIKQVIHDIKSPITSLNFILKSKNKSVDSISIPLERLNSLLALNSDENEDVLTDWYEIDVLINEIEKVKKEKTYIIRKINIINEISFKERVFFDPSLIKVFFAELIDNTIKMNMHNANIEATIKLTAIQEREILIEYSDNGVGIVDASIQKVGLEGYSTSGTGIGLFGLKSRVVSWGGDFIVEKSSFGFYCKLKLVCKNSD